MKAFTARSGIKVLLHETPSKLISCRYFVKCGAIDEQEKREQGLCHALEHMLFAGTNIRDWEAIQLDFRRVGAYSNASTALGFTEYEILVPAENFIPAFEILSDLFYNPTLPEDRWEQVEKGIIITEIQGVLDNPEFVAETSTMSHMLGPAFHPVMGTIPNIAKAKVKDLASFKEKYYAGDNIFLSVAGGIDQPQLLAIVNKYDKLGPRKPLARKKRAYKTNLSKKVFKKEGLGQTIIHFIKPCRDSKTLPEKINQSMALDMLNNYLMSEIREKRGLCYHIGVDVNTDIPQKSFFVVGSYSADKKTAKEIANQTEIALTNFLRGGVDQDNLLQSKMDNYRNFLGLESNPQIISDIMGESYAEGKGLVPFEDYYKILNQITTESVRKSVTNLVKGDYKITILEGD